MRGDIKAECDVKSAEAQRAHLKALQEATTKAAALRQAIDADLFALGSVCSGCVPCCFFATERQRNARQTATRSRMIGRAFPLNFVPRLTDFRFRAGNFFGVASIAANFSPIVGDSSFLLPS
jgi:hypothetical protein